MSAPSPDWSLPGRATLSLGDIRVHALRSGFVACKEAHRAFGGPDALRLPAIALDRRWTEWMPVLVCVVEHPEGVFLLDAGQLESTGDADALRCDPGTRWFYRNLLRLAFRPEERVDRRLAELGIDAERVRAVVLSHRHADHADGLEMLPAETPVFVGAEDWPGHQGALVEHWPPARTPTLVERGEAFDAFTTTVPLVRDGRVRIVSLPGHSPGHLGLLVVGRDGTRVLCAGDAVFSESQVRDRVIAGVCEDRARARVTVEVVARQLRARPTVLVPCHETDALARLGAGRTSALDADATGARRDAAGRRGAPWA